MAKQPMTAAELMARLQADPEWVRQNAERETRQKAIVQKLRSELRPEQAPLLRDLAEVGYEVSSIWDLVNMSTPYPEAIPVLLKHLKSARHPVLRNGIVRALAVKEAEGIAGSSILEELKQERNPEVRWAMANTLTIVGDRSDANEIEALIKDHQYEDVSERLQRALTNLRP